MLQNNPKNVVLFWQKHSRTAIFGGLSETTNLKNSNWIRCVSSSLGYLKYSGRPRLLLIGLHVAVEVKEAVTP